MFTKTQIEIMKLFVSQINRRFSIKEATEILKKPYPLIHRSIKSLIEQKFIQKDEKGLISLNYKENHSKLTYVESLRSELYLSKDKTLNLFTRDVKEKIGIDFFVFLIFGSYLEKSNPRDIDVLIIIENEDSVSKIDKTLSNIIGHFTKPFEIQVISIKSAHEMLIKRDKINILNETLNKHIILFGAENYYKILTDAR